MKLTLYSLILVLYGCLLYNRLPDWHSNKTIWVAAARVEPKDPWALNNAANYTHDNTTLVYLYHLISLDIPSWLPIQERAPYYTGYKSLSNTLYANGYIKQGDYVEEKLQQAIFKGAPKFTYIPTEANDFK